MELSQKQIDYLISHISVSDILNYIENNRSDYEIFLKEEKEKNKNEKTKESKGEEK